MGKPILASTVSLNVSLSSIMLILVLTIHCISYVSSSLDTSRAIVEGNFYSPPSASNSNPSSNSNTNNDDNSSNSNKNRGYSEKSGNRFLPDISEKLASGEERIDFETSNDLAPFLRPVALHRRSSSAVPMEVSPYRYAVPLDSLIQRMASQMRAHRRDNSLNRLLYLKDSTDKKSDTGEVYKNMFLGVRG